MTNLETFIHLKSEIERANHEFYTFIKDKKKELIMNIAEELKSIPGMNKVIVKGYTPGFNDGDACTHSSEVYYNKRYDFSEISQYGISGLVEFLGAPEDFIDDEDNLYTWEAINEINTYDDSDEDKIQKLCSLLDDIIEQTYDTDYVVFIDLTDDEPKISYQSYDCGH